MKIGKNIKLNQIVNCDVRQLLTELPNNCVDTIISSPPYNIGKEYEKRINLDLYLKEQYEVLRDCYRILKTTGSIFWQVGVYVDKFGGHVPLDIKFFEIFDSFNMSMRNRIVWMRPHGLHGTKRFSCRYETILWFVKDPKNYKFYLDPIRVPQKYQNKKSWKGSNKGKLTCDPLGKNPGDIWAFRNVKHNHEEQTIHPCQFPEDMIERVILTTTDENDVVFDPYMGTGTVAVAAKRFNRKFLGAEVDMNYYNVSINRINGEPDNNKVFPNLKTLREYILTNNITDIDKFQFAKQIGKKPTSKDKAKIFDEQHHLHSITNRILDESEEPAYKRFQQVGR